VLPFAVEVWTVLKGDPHVAQRSLASVYENPGHFVPRWSVASALMGGLCLAKLKREPNHGLLPNEIASIAKNMDVWIVAQCFGNEADHTLIPTTANPSANRFLQGIVDVNRAEHWCNLRHGMQVPNVPNDSTGLDAKGRRSSTKVDIGRAETEGSHGKEPVVQLAALIKYHGGQEHG
jgi:hypothetical protein